MGNGSTPGAVAKPKTLNPRMGLRAQDRLCYSMSHQQVHFLTRQPGCHIGDLHEACCPTVGRFPQIRDMTPVTMERRWNNCLGFRVCGLLGC